MGYKIWRVRAVAVAAAVFAMGMSPESSTDQDFTLHNHTEHIIKSLVVSPSGEARWSGDILGQDLLDDHTDLVVTFLRDQADCTWDVRAQFADGSTAQVSAVDFCSVSDVTFTR